MSDAEDIAADEYDDLEARLRALYDVALDSRAHVVAAEVYYDSRLLENSAKNAAEVLERLDAALADAGELL